MKARQRQAALKDCPRLERVVQNLAKPEIDVGKAVTQDPVALLDAIIIAGLSVLGAGKIEIAGETEREESVFAAPYPAVPQLENPVFDVAQLGIAEEGYPAELSRQPGVIHHAVPSLVR